MQQAAKSLFGVHDSHVSSIPEGGHGSIRMVDPQATQIQSTRINLSGTMDLQRDTTVADAVQSALSSDPGRCGAYSTVSRPGRATISRSSTAPTTSVSAGAQLGGCDTPLPRGMSLLRTLRQPSAPRRLTVDDEVDVLADFVDGATQQVLVTVPELRGLIGEASPVFPAGPSYRALAAMQATSGGRVTCGQSGTDVIVTPVYTSAAAGQEGITHTSRGEEQLPSLASVGSLMSTSHHGQSQADDQATCVLSSPNVTRGQRMQHNVSPNLSDVTDVELAEAIIDRCRHSRITRQRLVDNAWRSSGSCVEVTEEPLTVVMNSVTDDASRIERRSRARPKAKPSKNDSNRRAGRLTGDRPTEPPQSQRQAMITSCVEDDGEQQRRKSHAENEQRKSSHRVKEDKKSLPENGREKPTKEEKRKEASKEAGGKPTEEKSRRTRNSTGKREPGDTKSDSSSDASGDRGRSRNFKQRATRRGYGGDDDGGSSDGEGGSSSPRNSTSRHRRRRSRRRSHTRHDHPSDSGANYSYRRPPPETAKRWLKPDKFDGTSSFESFMCSFDNCARYNRWSRTDKLAHLRWSLTGTAAQLLWSAEDLNYEELVEKLKSRFGGKGMEGRFQTELRCRRRKRGETLRELAQDIRRLMSLAYPGEKSGLAEHLARNAFLTALDDPEFELKIREREPPDLETAARIAQQFEVSRGLVEASGGQRRVTRQVTEEQRPTNDDIQNLTARVMAMEHRLQPNATASKHPGDESPYAQQQTSNHPGGERSTPRRRRNRAVNHEETQDREQQLRQKVRELESVQTSSHEQVSKLEAENDALSKELAKLRLLEQQRAARSVPPVPRATEQPAQQFHSRQGGGDVARPPRVCFTCGEPGHFSRSCPRAGWQPQASSYVPPHHGQPSQRVAGTKTDAAITRASYLRARVNGQEVECLLDTGSEVSLLPLSLINRNMLEPTSQTLQAANGTQIAVLGEATVSFETPWYTTSITGLVSDHIVDVMLGIDWLAKNDASWDFRTASIRLGRHYHQLNAQRHKRLWCRRVILQQDIEVPPRSQVNLPCKVEFHRIPDEVEKTNWSTEPATLAQSVHVARTLTPPDKFSDVPVRVMNVSSQPRTIPAGTVVSNLEPSSADNVDPVCRTTTGRDGTTFVKQPYGRPLRDGVPDFIQVLIDGVHDATPESAVAELRELLLRNRDVFSASETDIGVTNIVAHHIDTGQAKPVRQQLRRFPPAHVEAISAHVDSRLKQNVIEPATSPWASNVVLVRKKDGSFRCCIDYRQLNSVTTKDAYPLPRIDSCLDAMSEAKWFSTIDLKSSYHQVPMAPEDSGKTAFICPRGMYRFKTMPFGLCNAGATFQRLMDVVMSGLHLDVCLVYLDDVVVFARSPEEHLNRLGMVFDRLRRAGLKLKPEKCNFFQRSVTFLGHVVSCENRY